MVFDFFLYRGISLKERPLHYLFTKDGYGTIGMYCYLYVLCFADTFSSGEGFRGAMLAIKTQKPGAGDFSQSPVGLSYGVSGWGLCSKTENRPLSYNITYT